MIFYLSFFPLSFLYFPRSYFILSSHDFPVGEITTLLNLLGVAQTQEITLIVSLKNEQQSIHMDRITVLEPNNDR